MQQEKIIEKPLTKAKMKNIGKKEVYNIAGTN